MLRPDVQLEKWVVRWRSIADIEMCMRWANGRGGGSDTKDKSFTATKSLDEYSDMLKEGWSTGVKGMQGLADMATSATDKLQFKRNLGGAFPLVPAHLANDPASMLEPRIETHENARSVALVVHNSYSGGTATESVMEYARKVMPLVYWLELEGIQTEVFSSIPTYMDDGVLAIYLTQIRKLGQVMAPERIAAVLHPSYLRRAYFALLEYEYSELSLPGTGCSRYGYGTPSKLPIALWPKVMQDVESVILLPPPGTTDPKLAVEKALNLKIRYGD